MASSKGCVAGGAVALIVAGIGFMCYLIQRGPYSRHRAESDRAEAEKIRRGPRRERPDVVLGGPVDRRRLDDAAGDARMNGDEGGTGTPLDNRDTPCEGTEGVEGLPGDWGERAEEAGGPLLDASRAGALGYLQQHPPLLDHGLPGRAILPQ